jgi:hypothetical protein
VLSISNSKAQAPNWEWAKQAGNASTDRVESIASDASGNVYITGFFNSSTITFGSTTLTNNGNKDIFLVKYSPSGSVLWAKSAGGNEYETGMGVTTDRSENVYITGNFNSSTIIFDTITLTSNGESDIFLAKYNSDGDILWAENAGGTSYETGYSVTTDASENVYVTGYFYSSTLTIGSTTLINNGEYDVLVIKCDLNGTFLWAKSAGGTDYESGISAATDASENVYVAGRFISSSITFGTTTLTNNGDNDIFLVKYNPDGNVLWAKSAGGNEYETSMGVATDISQNVYMTGWFNGDSITFESSTITNTGGSDIFLVKYDPTGSVLWAKDAGGSSSDVGYGLAVDIDKNVYVTGHFTSTTLDFDTVSVTNTTTSIYDDMFLVKYDSTGNALWAKAAGGTDNDWSFGVTLDASKNVYIAGMFRSPTVTFGSAILTNNGQSDAFLVKLSDITVNINENNFDNEIKLYPNPTNSFVNLKIQNKESEKLLVEITNINGQLIYKKQYNKTANSTIKIDLSSYPKGIYLIKIRTDKFVKVSKLVLQ